MARYVGEARRRDRAAGRKCDTAGADQTVSQNHPPPKRSRRLRHGVIVERRQSDAKSRFRCDPGEEKKKVVAAF